MCGVFDVLLSQSEMEKKRERGGSGGGGGALKLVNNQTKVDLAF